jgi:hypothetical protein
MNNFLGGLLCFLEVPVVLWLYYRCLDGEEQVWKKGKYWLLLWELFHAGVGMIAFLERRNGGFYLLAGIFVLAVFLILTVLWGKHGMDAFIKAAVFTTLFQIIYFESAEIPRLLFQKESYLDLTKTEGIVTGICMLSAGVLGFFLSACLFHNDWEKKLKQPVKEALAAVLLICETATVLAILTTQEKELMSTLSPILLGVTLFLLFAAVFLGQKRFLERERYLKSQRKRLLEDYYTELDYSQRLVSEICREMDRQLTGLWELTAGEGLEELLLETASQKQEYEKFRQKEWSGSRMVDELLWRKEKICKERRIGFSADLDQFDGGCVSEQDWLNLFVSLFDAGIDSCTKLEKGRERFIKIRVQCAGGFEVLNFSFSGDTSRLLESRKLFGKGRKESWKLDLAEQIAEKYGGNALVKKEEGVFLITVSLEIRERRREPFL